MENPRLFSANCSPTASFAVFRRVMCTTLIGLAAATASSWTSFAVNAVGAEKVLDKSAAELLPPSSLAYVEVHDPQAIVQLVYDHPLSQRIQATDGFKKATSSKEFLQFKAGVAIVEAQMELPWRSMVEKVLGGGIHFAFDADSKGGALLVRATDAATLDKFVSTMLGLAKADAAQRGAGDPVKSAEYRGIKAYEVNEVKFAVVGKWLIACNKSELAKQILDRFHDDLPSLAKNANFASAAQKRKTQTTGWGYIDIAKIRDAGVAKDLFRGPVDNPVGELLVGGLIANLQKTPYATLELNVTGEQQRLAFASPHDSSWVTDSREFYFGPNGSGRAPAPIQVSNKLFSLRTHRDVAAMWRRAGDLFNNKINEDFAKADAQLATLFSGKDFGDDILGAIKPELEIVVARQSFEGAKVEPAIKLPSFALVAKLRDPDKMQPELRRTFQSLIGFLNIVGAMNGQPQFETDIDKEEGRQVVSATYLADSAAKGSLPGKINFNFSPSIGFAGDRFVVASTKKLAHELTKAPQGGTDSASSVNTEASLNVPVLGELLKDNQAQLVNQNILQKGQTREEAEQEVGLLLTLLEFARTARLRLSADEQFRIELETQLKNP